MFETECPYCGEEIDVDPDGDNQLEPDKKHQFQCFGCNQKFVFTVDYTVIVESIAAECLNTGEHVWNWSCGNPRFASYKCADCGEVRAPTEEELIPLQEQYEKAKAGLIERKQSHV